MKERNKVIQVNKTPLNLNIIGKRDPRGYDNTVRVWLDQSDHLHIRVEKAQRCYRFTEMIDAAGHVELIQC